MLVGKELFTSERPNLDASPALTATILAFGKVEVVIGIWAAVVGLKCLGEAQGFSAWKALGNVLLVFIIVVIAGIAASILLTVLLVGLAR